MGHYIYQDVSIKLNVVKGLAEHYSLPEPKWTADKETGFEYPFLTASDVKQYVDAADTLMGFNMELPEVLLAAKNATMQAILYHVAQVMGSHARDYIYSAMCDADAKGLEGGERKNFLRKATEEYTLDFG